MTEHEVMAVTGDVFLGYIERLNGEWRPGRDGFGFLIWMGRGGVWEPMSEAEAGVWHMLKDRWTERVNAYRQASDASYEG